MSDYEIDKYPAAPGRMLGETDRTINIADAAEQIRSDISNIRIAAEHPDDAFTTRTLRAVLHKLNVDANGRLRVSSEATVLSSGTVTTVTNVTNLGNTTFCGMPISGYQQMVSKCGCFRSNLVVS